MAFTLPPPRYRNNRRFWAQSEVINAERAEAGLPPIDFDPAAERWLTAAQMRERYGVSDMWLWRRAAERDHQPEAA
jgi:hypothetical protein